MLTRIDASLWIVLATIMLNMLGVGLIWPIIPTLVQEVTGNTVSGTAAILGIVSLIFSLMQFVFTPIMGILADNYGRRPVMLICLLGLGLDAILLAWAPSVFWIIVGRALGGIFGATFSTANAYIVDTMEPGERATGFGFLGAAFGIGFLLGPSLGAILGPIDTRLPFQVAAALSLANFALGLFLLKESLPIEKRERKSLWFANPVGSIRLFGTHRSLVLLAVMVFLMTAAQRGMEALWVIFTQYQYDWGIREAGLSLTVVGMSYFVVQGFLVRPTINQLGEKRTIILGLLLCATMFALLSFNPYPWVAYLGIPLYALGAGCATPAIQAIASTFISDKQQGHLQGAISSVMSLSAVFGPVVAAWSFAYFTSPAAPFLFPGIYFFAGVLVFLATAALGLQITSPLEPKT